jgi:hypothetical protein
MNTPRMGTLPALSAIQRTNVILAALAALLLLGFRSTAASMGCALGAGVVIANLFLLSILARVLIASAAGGWFTWCCFTRESTAWVSPWACLRNWSRY